MNYKFLSAKFSTSPWIKKAAIGSTTEAISVPELAIICQKWFYLCSGGVVAGKTAVDLIGAHDSKRHFAEHGFFDEFHAEKEMDWTLHLQQSHKLWRMRRTAESVSIVFDKQ